MFYKNLSNMNTYNVYTIYSKLIKNVIECLDSASNREFPG